MYVINIRFAQRCEHAYGSTAFSTITMLFWKVGERSCACSETAKDLRSFGSGPNAISSNYSYGTTRSYSPNMR